MSAALPPPVGVCHRCGEPVRVGDERRETPHHGTSAAPDVLLHRSPCSPRAVVRTWT